MEQTRMDSETPYLPQDIMAKNLKRLPVKSLIRFRCVCKHWENLIKRRSFIADHLEQSNRQNPFLLFESDSHMLWYLRFTDCGEQVREVHEAPWIDSLNDASVVGSYNGLLCVEFRRYGESPPSLLVWNPATTAVRHVPPTRPEHDFCVTAFGFSSTDNDYKIVRIYEFYESINRVEVFSLSEGSWKEKNIACLSGVKIDSVTGTADGIIFWSGIKKESKNNIELVIVSFDMANEVFTLMRWPDFDHNADEKPTVYENKLAMLCHVCNVDAETSDLSELIDLWVMEEGTCPSGERQSWTKIYSGRPCSDALCPRTIWRNEIVCETHSSEEDDENIVYLVNVTTNEVRRVVIPYGGSINNIYSYVESLVPVDNNNHTEES